MVLVPGHWVVVFVKHYIEIWLDTRDNPVFQATHEKIMILCTAPIKVQVFGLPHVIRICILSEWGRQKTS